MPIDFHCPYCEKAIRANDDNAGKWAKCPACHQKVYVPTPPEQAEPLPLEPIDTAAERERQKLMAEDKEFKRRLMQERDLPDEPRSAGRGAERPTAAPAPVDMHRLVINYAIAMAQGRLEESEQFSAVIRRDLTRAREVIQQIISDDIPPAQLANIPRPVLIGFFKQLQA